MSAELVDHVFLPAFADPTLAGLGDSAVLDGAGRATGVLDRLVRRAADVLPRRLHRRPRGQRHGQRPGDERRAGAVPVGGVHPRGGHRRRPRSAAIAQRLGEAARRAGVRWSPATPRWSRPVTATGCTSTPPASGWCPTAWTSGPTVRQPGDVVIVSGDIGVHGVAIMSVREGSSSAPRSKRLPAAERAGGRDDRGVPGRPRASRPDPGWRGHLAERDREGVQGRGRRSTSAACRSPRWSRTPARSWVWTPSRSPTRASCWRSCPGSRLTSCWRRCTRIRPGLAHGSSASASRTTRAWCRQRRGSARRGSWTCRSANSCPDLLMEIC